MRGKSSADRGARRVSPSRRRSVGGAGADNGLAAVESGSRASRVARLASRRDAARPRERFPSRFPAVASPCADGVATSEVATATESDGARRHVASTRTRCHRQRGLPLSMASVSSWPCFSRASASGGGIDAMGRPYQSKQHVGPSAIVAQTESRSRRARESSGRSATANRARIARPERRSLGVARHSAETPVGGRRRPATAHRPCAKAMRSTTPRTGKRRRPFAEEHPASEKCRSAGSSRRTATSELARSARTRSAPASAMGMTAMSSAPEAPKIRTSPAPRSLTATRCRRAATATPSTRSGRHRIGDEGFARRDTAPRRRGARDAALQPQQARRRRCHAVPRAPAASRARRAGGRNGSKIRRIDGIRRTPRQRDCRRRCRRVPRGRPHRDGSQPTMASSKRKIGGSGDGSS